MRAGCEVVIDVTHRRRAFDTKTAGRRWPAPLPRSSSKSDRQEPVMETTIDPILKMTNHASCGYYLASRAS
jgi:hypothetical protein